MRPTQIGMTQWINDYLHGSPEGLDITAYVLDKIGLDDFGSYCGAKSLLGDGKKRRMDDAKRKMGQEVKEKLDSMFHIVDTLSLVPVDPARWPNLANWVTSYTQHRVDTARRKMW